MKILQVGSTVEALNVAGRLIPFRAPHYTCSAKALVEELGLARDGALYLDNAAEFRRGSIDHLASVISKLGKGDLPRAILVDISNPFEPGKPDANVKLEASYRARIQETIRKLLAAVTPPAPAG